MRVDPPVRRDGRCSVCLKPRNPERSRKYAGGEADRDPFCSIGCARSYHGLPDLTEQGKALQRAKRFGNRGINGAVILVAALLFAAPVGARTSHADRVAFFKAREHRQLATIRSARFTLLFFERHPAILYQGRSMTRRHAWRIVSFKRAQIGWTLRELGETQASLHRLLTLAIPHLREWLCIFSYENGGYGWTAHTGNGYEGGLQMNSEFQRTYGPEFLRRYGTADHWPARDQMVAAERAWKTRGFTPWPTTARYCGLLP